MEIEEKIEHDYSTFEYAHIRVSTGEVVSQGRTAFSLPPPAGCIEVLGSAPMNSYYDLGQSKYVRIPPQPGQYHKWDWTSKQWVFNEAARGQVWNDIQGERSRRAAQGVMVDNVWFHSDPTSRGKYMNIVLTEENEQLQWKALGDVWVTMDDDLALRLLRACSALDKALHAAAQAHKVAMYADPNPERYDWHSGWPISYAEASLQ